MADVNIQPKIAVSPETFEVSPASAPDSSVNVTNVSFVPILYRALSTAPKQFQVRPRQGVIETGQSETIAITYTNKGEADGSGKADGGDRKEEFKIEYCRMTPEHSAAIAAAGGSPSVITDLIKACTRAERKSKVITCNILSAAPAAVVPAAVEVEAPEVPAAEPVPVAAKKPVEVASAPAVSAPPSETKRAAAEEEPLKATAAARASERNATTDVLASAAADDSGLRSRATAPAAAPAAPAARPSATAAAAAGLPPPAAASAGPVSFSADPVGFLKQNPLVALGVFIGLYLIGKLLF